MKKATGTPKSNSKMTNKNKKKSPATPVATRVKALAKDIVTKGIKAMSGKAAKKPQVKAAPKPAAKHAAPAKHAPAKAAPAAKGKAAASAKHAAPAKAAPAAKGAAHKADHKADHKHDHKADHKNDHKKDSHAPAAKGKTPAAPATAAVLTKGKGEAGKTTKVKGVRMTAAQLAEYQEKMCRESNCENLATTKGYCRLDYIKNWKKIKRKEMILKEGKLNQYIEELVSKYPEKYIDVIRQDLQTEVNFNKVIHDLELDESIDDLDYDGDSIDALIGGIKKEGEDFGDEDF